MDRLTDGEAEIVLRNPGMFDKATEDEAWAIRHANLRAAAPHLPPATVARGLGVGDRLPARPQRRKP